MAQASSAAPGLEPILTRPEVALKDMSYAPAIRVSPDMDLVYFSGMTAYPPNVDPWNPGSTKIPDDLQGQTKMLVDNVDTMLKQIGITWQHIIMMVRYTLVTPGQTAATPPPAAAPAQGSGGSNPLRDKMGDWRPCSTTIGVHDIGVPGAKVMYDITAVAPRKK